MKFLQIVPLEGQTIEDVNEQVSGTEGTNSGDATNDQGTNTETALPGGNHTNNNGDMPFYTQGWFLFVVIIAIMYFLMIRPQRKQQKEMENFRRSLQPGMDVVTTGGVYGKIKEINENIVVIEIAHNVNVRVDISVVLAIPSAAKNNKK